MIYCVGIQILFTTPHWRSIAAYLETDYFVIRLRDWLPWGGRKCHFVTDLPPTLLFLGLEYVSENVVPNVQNVLKQSFQIWFTLVKMLAPVATRRFYSETPPPCPTLPGRLPTGPISEKTISDNYNTTLFSEALHLLFVSVLGQDGAIPEHCFIDCGLFLNAHSTIKK